ncbi:MAG: type II toxin-antitoxin system VapC family toxin [Planctomycetota bacterium]
MQLFDVNILVYAYRADSSHHERVRPWFEALVDDPAPFGMAELALSGFLRIVSNRKIFVEPDPIQDALSFAEALVARPNCVLLSPGAKHWEIFTGLCRGANVKGNLVPDAWFAALAIESGCQWVTCDRGFGRYPNLNWCEPPAT